MTTTTTELSTAGQALQEARERLAAASEAAKRAAVTDVRERGMTEQQAARHNALTRVTVRKALGKPN